MPNDEVKRGGVSVHRLKPQHIIAMNDRKAVADLLVEINMAIDETKRQLEDASRLHNTTGRDAGEWLNATRQRQRVLGQLSQAAQRRLGELNREAKRAHHLQHTEGDHVVRRAESFALGILAEGERRGMAKAIARLREMADRTANMITASEYRTAADELEAEATAAQST